MSDDSDNDLFLMEHTGLTKRKKVNDDKKFAARMNLLQEANQEAEQKRQRRERLREIRDNDEGVLERAEETLALSLKKKEEMQDLKRLEQNGENNLHQKRLKAMKSAVEADGSSLLGTRPFNRRARDKHPATLDQVLKKVNPKSPIRTFLESRLEMVHLILERKTIVLKFDDCLPSPLEEWLWDCVIHANESNYAPGAYSTLAEYYRRHPTGTAPDMLKQWQDWFSVDPSESSQATNNNDSSTEYWFNLWNIILSNGAKLNSEVVSEVLKQVTPVCLAPELYQQQSRLGASWTCFVGLLLQQANAQLSQDEWQSWQTSLSMSLSGMHIPPPRTGAEDADDTGSLLSRSLIVRAYLCLPELEFGVTLALQVLKDFLGISDWDQMIHTMLQNYEWLVQKSNESQTWRTLACIACACRALEDESLDMDPPKLLACTKILVSLAMAGFSSTEPKDGACFSKLLTVLEGQLSALGKVARNSSTLAHCRRAEIHLSHFKRLLEHEKDLQCQQPQAVQGTMDGWLKSSTNDLGEETNGR